MSDVERVGVIIVVFGWGFFCLTVHVITLAREAIIAEIRKGREQK